MQRNITDGWSYIGWVFVVVVVLGALGSLGTPADDMVRAGEKGAPDRAVLERARHPRTHIVIGTSEWRADHKEFLDLLKRDGHELSFSNIYQPSSSLPAFEVDGVPLYDNVILTAIESRGTPPSASLGRRCLEFMEVYHGSVLIFGSKPGVGVTTSITQRLGLQPITGQLVRDFFNNVQNIPTYVLSNRVPLAGSVMSSSLARDNVLYEGHGLTLNKKNALLFPLLHGRPTTYSGTSGGATLISGSEITLVAGLQTRENARMVVTPSTDLCSDKIFSLHDPNRQFCREVAEWVFRQRGVVDWSNLRHYTGNSTNEKEMYRILDPLTFSVDMHELRKSSTAGDASNSTTLAWEALDASAAARSQLEFTMLNPYWRLFLRNSQHTATRDIPTTRVEASFKCPEKCGIFKGVIDFIAKGYSFVHIETLTPLRTFKHNENERFIWSATPYYASTFISIAMVTWIVIFLLYGTTKTS